MVSVLVGLILALASGAFVHSFLRRRDFSPLPFWVALGLFIVVGSATQLPASPYFIGLQDGASYLEWAGQIEDAWEQGENIPTPGMLPIWPGKGVWPLFIAFISRFVSDGLFFFIVFNCILLSLSLVALQVATFLVSGLRSKFAIALIFLSNPAILLNGPTLLREAAFWFGVSVGILGLSFLLRSQLTRGFSILSIGVAVVMLIRPNLGIFIVYMFISLAASILLFHKQGRRNLRVVSGVGLALISGLTFGPSVEFFAEEQGLSNLPERASVIANGLSAPDVTTAITPDSNPIQRSGDNAGPNTVVISLIESLVRRLPHAFLGPFPYEIGPEPIWLLTIASTTHFLITLIAATLFHVRATNRSVLSVGLLAASIALVVGLATIMTNYGILIRFRVVSELVASPLAAGFLTKLVGRAKKSDESSSGGLSA